MIPNETQGMWLFLNDSWIDGLDATRARTHATPLPLQPLPHHVMVWEGFVYCRDWHIRGWKVIKHRGPLLPHIHPCIQDRCATRRKRRGGICCPGVAGVVKPAMKRSNAHAYMLNATYIWYSSIASTNCPHESKSVPFLKLACHFCTVLLTSDMLAGWMLAALSGQHSRGGDSSTGLQLWQRRWFGQHGYPLSRRAQWHSDQALSAWSP